MGRKPGTVRWAAVAIAVAGLTGCIWLSGPAAPQASLRVSATGIPTGALRDTVAVRIASEGTIVDVMASDVRDALLENLTPGSYSVTVFPVRTAHEIVDTVLNPVSPPAQVELTEGGVAEIDLTFAARPGSGALWVSSGASLRLVQYPASEISSSGTPTAALDADLSGGTEPMNQDLAVLPDGSMWLARYTGSGALNAFHPDQWADLEADAPLPSPALTVTNGNGALSQSTSLTVNADGSLFVVQYTPATIVRLDGLTATELDPEAGATLEVSPDAIFETPSDAGVFHSARFDPDGNLWVGTWIGSFDTSTRALLRFSREDLTQSGAHTIAPDLSGDLDVPFVVAFDADGRLWVAVHGPGDYQGAPDGRLLRFDEPDTLSDGFTASDADLSLEVYAAPGDRVLPVGLAFDNSGFLWTADYDSSDAGSGRMVRIDVSAIPAGATSVTAAAVFTGTPASAAGDWGTYLAFNPPPGM